MSDRNVKRSRVRAPRRRATARERALTLQLLIAEETKNSKSLTPGQIRERAEQRLRDLLILDPAITDAVERLAPTSCAPDRRDLHPRAMLAAALSQPAVTALLRTWALTPQRRGPVADLSAAVAALCDIAASPDRCDLRSTFARMNVGSLATLWTHNLPSCDNLKENTYYRHVVTLCGRGDKPGHNPWLAATANIALIRELAETVGDDGNLLHPRIGHVGIVDGTRLRAPIQQIYPRNPEHLELLRRDGMDLVDYSLYERDGQREPVLGWRETRIIDQASGRTIISILDRATSHEPHVLLRVLLPKLFELWPDCPMHTIVGDGLYDDHDTCFDLEARWSLHPIFTRVNPRNTTTRIRGGGTARVCDGQPICACGPMRFYQREGFYSQEQRALDRLPRGAMAPNIKAARVRWRCPNGRCKEISAYLTEDPRDHAWWPRRGNSNPATECRVYTLYRNMIESSFADTKGLGIGSAGQPALWARDSGTTLMLALHNLLATATRVAHANGSYQMFHDEYERLGLNRACHAPSLEDLERERRLRPAHLQWAWPPPGRLPMTDPLASPGQFPLAS